ncbi:MAG: PQ-loop repeat-containing protein [Polyangiaceae bacterium]
MTGTWLLGAAGLVAIEGSYVPQIVRLFRLKKADEISYLFPGLNLAGRVMALAYSVAVGDSVFVVGFLVGATLRLVLLTQVAWYRHRPPSIVPLPSTLAREAAS